MEMRYTMNTRPPHSFTRTAWRQATILVLLVAGGCGDGNGASSATTLAAAPRCEVPAAAYQLARLSRCPGAMVVDDDYVYWLDGRLMRMPKCGSSSAPEVLLDPVAAYDLAIDASAVYLANAFDVVRVDTHTLEVSSIAHVDDFNLQQIWAQDGWVYFTTEGVCIAGETDCGSTLKPLIHRVPAGGGAPEVVFRYSGGQVFDLVGSGDSLYMTGSLWSSPQGIERLEASGGDKTELLPAGEPVGTTILATDGAFVYYASDPGIRKVSTSGGPSVPVGEETLGLVGLAGDGQVAYWAASDRRAVGTVKRARSLDAPAEILAEGHDMTSIAIDRGAVYFGTCGLGDDAGVWIVAR
jgi:hypothetical protein